MLAIDLEADVLAIVTDVDAVYAGRALPSSDRFVPRRLRCSPAPNSPRVRWSQVRAACEFAERTGKTAIIGSIADTAALIRGDAGTVVALDAGGVGVGTRG